jgi:hypothetical protein
VFALRKRLGGGRAQRRGRLRAERLGRVALRRETARLDREHGDDRRERAVVVPVLERPHGGKDPLVVVDPREARPLRDPARIADHLELADRLARTIVISARGPRAERLDDRSERGRVTRLAPRRCSSGLSLLRRGDPPQECLLAVLRRSHRWVFNQSMSPFLEHAS